MGPRTSGTLSGLVATTGLVILAGCAVSPAATEAASHADRQRCVSTLSLTDWEVLDDSTLLVWTVSRSRAYRIELVRPMHDLRFEYLTAEQTTHLLAQRPHKRKPVKTVTPEPGDAGKACEPTAPPQ